MSGTRKYLPLHHHEGTPKRRMTLFTRHRNTVEPMMLADNRKTTLHAIYTDAVNKTGKDQKSNIVLDDLPHPINDSEKDLTRKERATLAHLSSGYCKLLGSYKSRKRRTLVSTYVPTAARRQMTSSISSLAQLIRRH